MLKWDPLRELRQINKQHYWYPQQKEYLTFFTVTQLCSSGCLKCWPGWPAEPPETCSGAWAAWAVGVTATGAGLGGPDLVEDSWPWCVLPWQLEDWLLPDCPTPPWSWVFGPWDLAWAVWWNFSVVWTFWSLRAGVLEGFVLCFSFLEDFGCFPDPDLDFWRPLHP